MTEFTIPQAPDEIYESHANAFDTIMSEVASSYMISGYDFDKGMQQHVIGANFPKKGFPKPEAIWAINLVKKTVIEGVKLLAMPQFWPSGAMFLILPKRKFIKRTVEAFNRLSLGAMSPYIMKPQFMTPFGRELRSTIKEFMLKLGIDERGSEEFSKILSSVIDYDTAYRYRLEDLMSETNGLKLWKRPIKEVRRLTRIIMKRETNPMISSKFRQFSYLVVIALMSPKIRRAFKKAIGNAEFKNLQYDEADRYWCLQKDDYLYLGMTYEERQGIMGLLGYSTPTSYLIHRK